MRFKLTETGLKHYQKVLEQRVAAFKVAVADLVYRWQVPPAGEDFMDKDKHPYFSGYFRANWQVSINGQSTPEIPEYLRPSRAPGGGLLDEPDSSAVEDLFRGDINPDKLADFMRSVSVETKLEHPIVIYNPTWYGAWLNDGGYNVETVLGNWKYGKKVSFKSFMWHTPPPQPSGGGTDFMRQCMDYMRGQDYGAIMKKVRREYAQLYTHGG